MILRKIIPIFLAATTVVGSSVWANDSDRVAFPQNYKSGVHYTTVERGNIREEIYASAGAIAAAKQGLPLPSGTVITMEDYRDGHLYRYVVMEKRDGWGQRHSEESRNGDWEFQSFQPDLTVNRSENVVRCMACHKGQEKNDFVFTLSRMRDSNANQVESSLRRASLMHVSQGGTWGPGDLTLLTPISERTVHIGATH